MKTRIVLVDDHPIFRKGLASLIAKSPRDIVVGEASDRSEAIQVIEETHPDVVLLDLSLGGDNGLELLKDLMTKHTGLRVLILSMHDERVYAERSLAAGAFGYVQKDEVSQRVLEAVSAVSNGRKWFSDDVKELMLQNMLGGGTTVTPDVASKLTDRELEVFTWMGRGLGSRMIAEKIGLSIKTIDTHKEHIKQKLGCATTQELRILANEWLMLK
ncbi:MAG: response regulator transcription factor [Spirochaetales bacterium]|nr:response regulator transcription factor [Spirochaetales bacterium]